MPIIVYFLALNAFGLGAYPLFYLCLNNFILIVIAFSPLFLFLLSITVVSIVIDNVDLAGDAETPLRATQWLRQLVILILNHRILWSFSGVLLLHVLVNLDFLVVVYLIYVACIIFVEKVLSHVLHCFLILWNLLLNVINLVDLLFLQLLNFDGAPVIYICANGASCILILLIRNRQWIPLLVWLIIRISLRSQLKILNWFRTLILLILSDQVLKVTFIQVWACITLSLGHLTLLAFILVHDDLVLVIILNL